MTRCPSDATKPHPKEIAARLVDEWLEPVPHADKPDPVLLLNLVERIGSALHAAATEARRGALEEAAGVLTKRANSLWEAAQTETTNSGWWHRYTHAKEICESVAYSIRTLAAKEAPESAPAPHPMEKAARLVDEWSAANFRTHAERPEASVLLDLVKRIAAKEGE